MKYFILILCAALFLTPGCKKIIYGEGNTRVKGQVLDKFSGDPVPGAWVEILAQGDDSWYAPYIVDSVPTDNEGKFDHTFHAQRDYDYFARGSYHKLYANYNDLMVDLKDGWGNKKLELELYPCGWVKANFVNVPPIDIANSISLSSVSNPIDGISNVKTDTFLIGRTHSMIDYTLTTFVRKGSVTDNQQHQLFIPALDTIEINIKY